jgi:hypothetical protein
MNGFGENGLYPSARLNFLFRAAAIAPLSTQRLVNDGCGGSHGGDISRGMAAVGLGRAATEIKGAHLPPPPLHHRACASWSRTESRDEALAMASNACRCSCYFRELVLVMFIAGGLGISGNYFFSYCMRCGKWSKRKPTSMNLRVDLTAAYTCVATHVGSKTTLLF